MSELKIITNNQPRPAACWRDLDAKWQKEFDYVEDSDQPRFVRYNGEWYDAVDAQRITTSHRHAPMGWDMHVEPESPLAKWHAIASDSYFSGMLFRFGTDFGTGEGHIVVGRYFS